MGTNAKARRRTVKQILWVIYALLFAGAAFYGYLYFYNRETLASGEFRSVDGSTLAAFSFEVRHTCAGRQEGLMFRRKEDFPADRAMLFIFPSQRKQSFWMMNTLIPLDMVFIDRNFQVVGILPEVPPLNQVSRSVEQPSQYVVELNSGVAAQKGIVVGSRLVMGSQLPSPTECPGKS
jgi:uncharacterized membrane protein (UPF0127 family)